MLAPLTSKCSRKSSARPRDTSSGLDLGGSDGRIAVGQHSEDRAPPPTAKTYYCLHSFARLNANEKRQLRVGALPAISRLRRLPVADRVFALCWSLRPPRRREFTFKRILLRSSSRATRASRRAQGASVRPTNGTSLSQDCKNWQYGCLPLLPIPSESGVSWP